MMLLRWSQCHKYIHRYWVFLNNLVYRSAFEIFLAFRKTKIEFPIFVRVTFNISNKTSLNSRFSKGRGKNLEKLEEGGYPEIHTPLTPDMGGSEIYEVGSRFL